MPEQQKNIDVKLHRLPLSPDRQSRGSVAFIKTRNNPQVATDGGRLASMAPAKTPWHSV